MHEHVDVMAAAEVTVANGAPPSRWFRDLLSCIRFDEVLVLQGAPLLGAVCGIEKITGEGVTALLAFAAGSCLLVAHIFVFNDWSGMHADLRDPHRATPVFTTRRIRRTDVRNLSIGLLAMSLLVLLPYGPRTLGIALVITGLSALYSAPWSQMKGRPLVSSALHLSGGFFHFLLGYSVFRHIDRRGLAIACCVGLIFTAGHLTHEVRDADSDRRSGIRTNAVAFGTFRSFVAGLLLFALADFLLAGLGVARMLPQPVMLVAALYLLHLYWSLQALREGLTFRAVRSLQIRYRVLYAAIGILVSLSVLLTNR